jgi:dTDP-4-amino-4,6-dideoxygalactose transaminase
MTAIDVPLFEPDLTEADKQAVRDVLDSGWITMGPKVAAFEERFASYVGAGHAIAVNSCTAALHLANVALDLGPGDEVIVPSLTFAATANAVAMTGATAVFADVKGLDDWTIDPDSVAARITSKTRAVVVMHYGGYACDMNRLKDICDAAGIALVEDAAHALTGYLDGRHLGTIGRIGCFSFFSNKVMTTAEGGMLVTDDAAIADRARRMRSHGQTKTAIDRMNGALGYEIEEAGYNYRLDDIRAALGLSQMDRLDRNLANRQALVERYRETLGSINRVSFPSHGDRGTPAHYILPVIIDGDDRDVIRERMAQRGIQTSLHYPPVHLFSHYRKDSPQLPVTERIAARTITLPLFHTMTIEQVDVVVSEFEKALAEN